MSARVNYLTRDGYRRLREEYDALFGIERPKLVETISWAAGNGDRSENGDYIYGRKRLREIDRRLGWLSKRLSAARIIDPTTQPDKSKVFFGATVMIMREDDDSDDAWSFVTIVGDDEAAFEPNCVGWNSPMARALRGGSVDDVRAVTLPSGERLFRILQIDYHPADQS